MNQSAAPYAVAEQNSRGRQYPEPQHPYRSDFERDRDRIIHSAAFRRLEGKTQVFTTGLNDQYRTRLTHSIEVAQIGRTIARVLGLNESLTEAICLAHDLGHAPFGHTGENILNELTKDVGGFEHNRQSLRIVELLEHPYPDFAGLNLMYETRLGLARHSSTYDNPDDVDWPQQASLEGQIADIADRIAYNCHDLEDGMRSQLIHESQLSELEMYQAAAKKLKIDRIDDYVIRRTRLSKTMMDMLVSDAIQTSRQNIANAEIVTLQQVLQHSQSLITISPNADHGLKQLESFLMQNVYKHPDMQVTEEKVKRWLSMAFDDLCRHPQKMPSYFQNMIDKGGLHRTACDYLSGMTDRFCLKFIDETQ